MFVDRVVSSTLCKFTRLAQASAKSRRILTPKYAKLTPRLAISARSMSLSNKVDGYVPPSQLRALAANTFVDHLCGLDIDNKSSYVRLTGIICTIGPASVAVDMLEKIIETGMNIARLNFSHGSYEYHGQTIKNIRQAVENYSKRIGMPHALAIALDTKGPEIRTGLLQGGGSAEVELVKGQTIRLTTDAAFAEKGSATDLYVDYTNITKVVKPGSRIFVDDGLISLVVKSIGKFSCGNNPILATLCLLATANGSYAMSSTRSEEIPKQVLIGKIEPSPADWLRDVDTRVAHGIKYGRDRKFLNQGDPVIVVTGWKKGAGFTNTVRIVYVSDNLDEYLHN
ncbi:pyruvate kinase-like [Diaphorina citri]|uniref:pyruvate kinase n=1 Tax=Diaphorina citri TaxID=121845 RepID=A0A3Q0J9Y8_DIACI|nr:pyruvate kinase-like [Diaphorina citri]